MSIFGLLFIGLITGWLAGLIRNSGGLRLVIDLMVGAVGALVGGYLLHVFAIQVSGFFGGLVAATISAILALLAIGFVKHSP